MPLPREGPELVALPGVVVDELMSHPDELIGPIIVGM